MRSGSHGCTKFHSDDPSSWNYVRAGHGGADLKKHTPACRAHKRGVNVQPTLCNPHFLRPIPFPPYQEGRAVNSGPALSGCLSLSLPPSPSLSLSLPGPHFSPLLSDQGSSVLLISIRCRFHFPGTKTRGEWEENERGQELKP